MAETTVKWLDHLTFEADLDGHKFKVDASPEFGGRDQGPRPKGLLLVGLAGCTGMDVVSMLEKMKMKDFTFEMKVKADLVDEHPKVYKDVTLQYIFVGDNLNIEHIKKAIHLSEDKYCAVSAMLKNSFEINIEIIVNGKDVS